MSNPSNSSIAQTFKAGDKLAGCYTLKEILPAQGLCVVWLAHDEELNKDIALHFVPDSVAADQRALSELRQEAKRNRQLIHPRIVRVHDLVEENGWAAISMDHAQGETLAALQQKREKKAFNPSELAAGISELCQTLEDAHRVDLYHRDLTPENLLATSNGLMVQGFGFSRVILDALAREGKTLEGARDIAYISPQQLDGERPSRTDDIYSVGATMFELLTGTAPFSQGDTLAQIRKTIPPPVSEQRAANGIEGEPTPKAWDDVIAACLAKNFEDRPKSAAEVGSRFAAGKAGAGSTPAAPAQAAVAAAAAGAAAAAAEAAKPGPAPAGGAAIPAEPEASPEKEAKQQKRPWGMGPAKAPVIAEATVLSKTAVPKGESKGESKAESKAEPGKEPSSAGEPGAGGVKKGPTSPSGFPLGAFVEVEGDKPAKAKSPAGLIIGGLLAVIVIVAYIVARTGSGSGNGTAPAVATSGSAQASPAGTAEAQASAPAASETPAPATAEASPAAASASPAPAEAAPPPPVATVNMAALGAMTLDQANQLMAQKASAVDQAKAALAAAEKAASEKAGAQSQAAAAVQEVQAAIKQKSDAAAAAKKAADDAAASLKKQQETLQKAEADAAEAQKAAAAKAQAADQLRKAMQDAQAAAQQQTAAEQQAEADVASQTRIVAATQKAADAAARAAADAEKARAQQAQALAQAQADLAAVQSGLKQAQQSQEAEQARKAAEQAAEVRKEREEETAKLAAQAAAAAKAAEDAQKALEVAKKAVADAEAAQRAAEQQAAAAASGTASMAAPAATPAAPSAASPAGAAAGPAPGGISPTLSVKAPNPHSKVDQALTNSLGMRFAPVGKVYFSIWLTRVQDFQAFASATGYTGDAWQNPGFKQAPDHPVVNVSWNDANKFCLWLTQKEHHEGILAANETYRLPTDLEWSMAVGLPPESGRTPESRDMDVPDIYPWGTQWPPPAGAGNYTGEETDSDVAIKGYNDGFAWTSPVGSFNANKYGLYDMGGNVWEWCLDWWNGEQNAKVLRGGSWYNGALKLSLLSSCRIHAGADEGTDNYGFRVVLAQEMTKGKGAKHRIQ